MNDFQSKSHLIQGVPPKLFLEFDTFFFNIHFKNTFNLIFLGFKMPSERFFRKDFKTGLAFLNMWF
jgi:hypothetical protein